MTPDPTIASSSPPVFSFFKGKEDTVRPQDGEPFDWDAEAKKVRHELNSAMSARNVAFLLGSGCSSLTIDKKQLGIPTMRPLAQKFVGTIGDTDDDKFITKDERRTLSTKLGMDLDTNQFSNNLERLMEVLYGFSFVLERSKNAQLTEALPVVHTAISKVTKYILYTCTHGEFSRDDNTIFQLYEAFYRKLVYRDRSLPRPWIFTTNYDLFNEIAMDRLSIPYSNGFTGTIERQFNPSSFRYALAEQLDLLSRKWTAVENFIYLCKLHGSINWIEHQHGLFPIREVQDPASYDEKRILIFPTPAKHSTSFASPYADLFREFQARTARDQTVLFVIGYAFGDEHVNNIIFQALTVPTFRLIIFASPSAGGIVEKLRSLDDPRIWLIGGDGPYGKFKAHYFPTIVERFMPEPPGDKVDTAVAAVLKELVGRTTQKNNEES